MSNTYPKLFPLYEFGAQHFGLYQMTVTVWAKNYQANPLLRFFDGFRNRMIYSEKQMVPS